MVTSVAEARALCLVIVVSVGSGLYVGPARCYEYIQSQFEGIRNRVGSGLSVIRVKRLSTGGPQNNKCEK